MAFALMVQVCLLYRSLPDMPTFLQQCQVTTDLVRVHISPKDFVSLTLPVYKAMFSHMPTMAWAEAGPLAKTTDEWVRSAITPKHYSRASFARLLVLAGRRLRPGTVHFETALNAVGSKSGLVLAPNLVPETVGHRGCICHTSNKLCNIEVPQCRHS